jgi:hypothetical protein
LGYHCCFGSLLLKGFCCLAMLLFFLFLIIHFLPGCHSQVRQEVVMLQVFDWL